MKDALKEYFNTNKSSVTIAITAIVMLFYMASCGHSKTPITEPVIDREHTPQLAAYSITTIISDSGVIRYRISTNEWKVFDKAEQPYWDFPEGLHFERFDRQYNVDAQITCKRAKYLEQLQLWELNDSVRATNLSGERFETEQLFWNQKTEKVYSDSLIRIIQTDKIIEGRGFESNQTFTRYDIHHPTGVFPIDKDESEKSENSNP